MNTKNILNKILGNVKKEQNNFKSSNKFKKFKPLKHETIANKPVQVFNKYPIPKKQVIKNAYNKIPDDTSVPLQFMTRKQYMNRYIKNQELQNGTQFTKQAKSNFIKNRTPHYSNIIGRYTTKHNEHYPPAVVVFNDPSNFNNIKGKKFKDLAFHEYGHELVEKHNIKLSDYKEEQFADNVAEYGKKCKVFNDTQAKNYALNKLQPSVDNQSEDKTNKLLKKNIDNYNIIYTRPRMRGPSKPEDTITKHKDLGKKRGVFDNTVKKYPNIITELNNYDGSIIINDTVTTPTYGSYNVQENLITLPYNWQTKPARERAETLFHELQHAKDSKEINDSSLIIPYQNQTEYDKQYDKEYIKYGYKDNKYERKARYAGAKGISDVDYSHLTDIPKQSFINERMSKFPDESEEEYAFHDKEKNYKDIEDDNANFYIENWFIKQDVPSNDPNSKNMAYVRTMYRSEDVDDYLIRRWQDVDEYPTKVRLYHGTTKDNLKSIKQKGLQPQSKTNNKNFNIPKRFSDNVSLSENKSTAYWYSKNGTSDAEPIIIGVDVPFDEYKKGLEMFRERQENGDPYVSSIENESDEVLVKGISPNNIKTIIPATESVQEKEFMTDPWIHGNVVKERETREANLKFKHLFSNDNVNIDPISKNKFKLDTERYNPDKNRKVVMMPVDELYDKRGRYTLKDREYIFDDYSKIKQGREEYMKEYNLSGDDKYFIRDSEVLKFMAEQKKEELENQGLIVNPLPKEPIKGKSGKYYEIKYRRTPYQYKKDIDNIMTPMNYDEESNEYGEELVKQGVSRKDAGKKVYKHYFNKMVDSVKSEEPLVPMITIYGDDVPMKKQIGEGRHRILSAKESGMSEVPVLIEPNNRLPENALDKYREVKNEELEQYIPKSDPDSKDKLVYHGTHKGNVRDIMKRGKIISHKDLLKECGGEPDDDDFDNYSFWTTDKNLAKEYGNVIFSKDISDDEFIQGISLSKERTPDKELRKSGEVLLKTPIDLKDVKIDNYSDNFSLFKRKPQPEEYVPTTEYPEVTNPEFVEYQLTRSQYDDLDNYGETKSYSGQAVGNTMIAADVVIPSGKLLTGAGLGVKKYVDKVKLIKTDENDNRYKIPRVEVHMKENRGEY